MAEIAGLIGLWRDRARASASVKQIAQAHVNDLEKRIQAMQALSLIHISEPTRLLSI